MMWIAPAILTLVAIWQVWRYRPIAVIDYGRAFLGLVWGAAVVTAWAMWGLSWVMGG